jgi:poly(hydroxyalkanoate) granule-associated protein
MDSAQQIWLAGMGAFGRAQEEGTKLFETLVREGSTLETKTRRMATGRVDAVRDAVENRVGAVKERAADTWDRLEKVFEDRVQRALTRLGVPGREDLRELSAKVDSLNAELRNLRASRAASTAQPAAKPARPAAKKPAAKAPAKGRRIKDITG